MAQPDSRLRRAPLLILLWSSIVLADVPSEVKQSIRTGDFAAAKAALDPLAAAGDADALYQLGRLYQLGLGVPRDDERAYSYYHAAALQAHGESAYLVGNALATGKGVQKDTAAARRWLAKARDAGNDRAGRKLAQLDARVDAPAPAPRESAAELADALASCATSRVEVALKDATRKQQAAGSAAPTRDSLLQAVACDDPALLEILIANGASLTASDAAGNTPLHRAIALEQLAGARVLMAHGAQIHAANDAGWTPAMLADRSRNAELKQLITPATTGAQSESRALQAAAQSSSHRGWSSLAIAAWEGEDDAVRALIADGEDVNAVDQTGVSALQRAVSQGEVAIAQMLLAAGASARDQVVFSQAVAQSLTTLLAPLLDAGAELEPADPNQKSPLFIAVSGGHQEAVETLLQLGAPPDLGYQHMTPMMLAAREGQLEIVTLLLDSGASPLTQDDTGCAALCWALRAQRNDVSLLLAATPAKNLEDNEGVTMLMLAADAGFLECVQLFVESGTDVDRQSRSGSHALLLAAAHGSVDVARYLLDNNAEIDQPNNAGDTALIAAVRNDRKETAALLLQRGANARLKNARLQSARALADAKGEDWESVFENESGFWQLISGGR